MFYVSSARGTTYGVTDTKDRAEEFYSSAQLSEIVSMGINIEGYIDSTLIVPMVYKSDKAVYAGDFISSKESRYHAVIESPPYRRSTNRYGLILDLYFLGDDEKLSHLNVNGDVLGQCVCTANRTLRNLRFISNSIINTRVANIFPFLPEFINAIKDCEIDEVPKDAEVFYNDAKLSETFFYLKEGININKSQSWYFVSIADRPNAVIYLESNKKYYSAKKLSACRDRFRMTGKVINFSDLATDTTESAVILAKCLLQEQTHKSLGMNPPELQAKGTFCVNYTKLPLTMTLRSTGVFFKCVNGSKTSKLVPVEALAKGCNQDNRLASSVGVSLEGDKLVVESLQGTHIFSVKALNYFYGNISDTNKKELVTRKLTGQGDADIYQNGELHKVSKGRDGFIVIPKSCTKVVDDAVFLSIDGDVATGLKVSSNVKAWSSKACNYLGTCVTSLNEFKVVLAKLPTKVALNVLRSLFVLDNSYFSLFPVLSFDLNNSDITTILLSLLGTNVSSRSLINTRDDLRYPTIQLGNKPCPIELLTPDVVNTVCKEYFNSVLKRYDIINTALSFKRKGSASNVQYYEEAEENPLFYNEYFKQTNMAISYTLWYRFYSVVDVLIKYLDPTNAILWKNLCEDALKVYHQKFLRHKDALLVDQYKGIL